MPSWQARAAAHYLRATRKRRYRTPEDGARSVAQGQPDAAPPRSLRDRLRTQRVPGAQVHRVAPPGGGRDDASALVYWHGGAFVNGVAMQHWRFVDRLAAATGREVLVPLYGLAPAHTIEEALPLLGAVLESVPEELPVHVLGDSAGGTLALLQTQSHPGRVAGLTLIAPWLDLSMSNPAVDALEPLDPWLTRAGLRPAAAAWAPGRDLQDPQVSPLFGDVERLPPTLVVVGDRDICLPDCEVLTGRAGPGVRLRVGRGLPHVYPLLPLPEARRARGEIVRHVQESLRRATG